MEIKFNFIFLLILINIPFLISKSNKKEFNNIIESYLNEDEDEIKTIDPDHFISGNITNENMNYYKINLLLNDSDKIYFDYQSEYGCLYVFFDEKIIYNSSKSDFIFCSEGINRIFELKKTDIIKKINKTKIDDTKMYISVGHNKSEINKKEYQYSMKISFSKPDINIFEINSEHKILCKTEKFNETYICLFTIVYSNTDNDNGISNEKNLIIYPESQIESVKLNIYSDFMNKDYYDEWNSNYLIENIPNINSSYSNYDSQKEFIFINATNEDRYIYICIQSDKEVTIEMHSHYLYKNEEIKLPKMNEIQFYNIHPNQNKISFNFNPLKIYGINLDKDIIISLVTLNGKASIYFENGESKKFITDTKENRLFLNLNNQNINYNLTINNLEFIEQNNNNENEDNLGYIFYIKYWIKNNRNMNEFTYNKSFKLSYDNINFPIILYSQIPNNNSPINLNLHFYNISDLDTSIMNDNIFNIEISILSTDEIYKLKKDPSFISNVKPIKGKFDSILFASNIYLSIEDMEQFNVKENPWIYIQISSKRDYRLTKLILGSTISQVNSLIYPSERIYHYGEIHTEKKIVYKLAGNKKLHLIALEISFNSNSIGYSIKRTNSDTNYIYNDTDLDFVSQNTYNGRGLLTLNNENGKDIYLTIFNREINSRLSNYVFKYINVEKISDFNYYYISNDALTFSERDLSISVHKISNLPDSSTFECFVKIIDKENYINNEIIKTIAITQSIGNSNIKGIVQDYLLIFNINYGINRLNFYSNAYCKIIGENYDIDYLSYNGLLNDESKENGPSKSDNLFDNINIITISVIIILILIIVCVILRCIQKKKLRELEQQINSITFKENSGEDEYL